MSDAGHEVLDGLAVYEHRRPGAPRVVFVHGSMDRSASFVKAIRRLGGLDTVRYDRRGYGRSTGAGVHEDIEGHIEDLRTVMGDRPAVLVGHSLGGLLALAVAEREPDRVRAVGAFEAPMPWLDWWPSESAGGRAMRAVAGSGDEAAAEIFMRRIIGDDVWERLPASSRGARRAEGRALIAEIRAIRAHGAPYQAPTLTVPVVAGLGTASDWQLQRAARELAGSAPGAELVEIEDATHRAPTTHPDAFADFVRRVVARAAER